MQRRGGHVGEHLAVGTVEDAQLHRPSVTAPTTLARTSQRRHSSSTRSSASGVTMASMRSWLSLVMTSNGSMPGSRRGTSETIDVHADATPRRRLARRAREPGAAEVLDADDQALVEQSRGTPR